MIRKILYRTIAITLIVGLTPIAYKGNATESLQSSVPRIENKANRFEPPNDGAPGDRQDAGSRPGCPQFAKPFTALVPATNLGVTVAERPTFWLYVPYSSGSITLSLKDEQTKKTVYQNTFEVNGKPGIMGFALPSDAPSLEVGKKYRWKFDLFCNPQSKADFFSVNGVILRQSIPVATMNQLKDASPTEQANLYAANGIWYETLTALAELRRDRPQDKIFLAQWTALLQHPIVRLEKMIFEPIVSCCDR
ncbi:MAG: DUF928 domain-containing protein [Hydrococcus sp. Prado102]|jgi:hypothetical protein|nr:DUF928 domain-containing protein [Hydrococcus sp. Prado102]